MPNPPNDDVKIGFVVAGLLLMILVCLLLLVVEVGLQQVLALGLLFIIGLGLTVAGTPDPRNDKKENDDAGPL